jgi:hypothetical protein
MWHKLIASIIIGIFSPLIFGQDLQSKNHLSITHFNVPTGDATLILGPGEAGKRLVILIDAGGPGRGIEADSGTIIGDYLGQLNIRVIDYFILSHYAEEHVSGMLWGAELGSSFILGPDRAPGKAGYDDNGNGIVDWQNASQKIPDSGEIGQYDDILIKHIIDSGPTPIVSVKKSKWYQSYDILVSSLIRSGQIKRTRIRTKSHINNFKLELGDGSQLLCLASNGYVRDRAGRVSRVNSARERGMAFILIYNDFSYLSLGDLSGRTWHGDDAKVEGTVGRYLYRYRFTPIDVLKVSHHGSNSTSSTAFLSMIKPRIAVIFSELNRTQNLPHPETLRRLVHFGTWFIYKTKGSSMTLPLPGYVQKRLITVNGHIHLKTDGTLLQISPGGRIINCK